MADFNNLYSAYLEARKGKRWKYAVVRYEANVLENIMFLHFNADQSEIQAVALQLFPGT